MRYKTAFRHVMREYELARDRAEFLADARRSEVYHSVPRVAEINHCLANYGASLAKLALRDDTTSMNKIRSDIAALKDERRTLLMEIGADEDYLSAVFQCKKCSDTGYISTGIGAPAERCSCLKQKLIDEYYALSNMKEVLQEENFEHYDFRLFSKEIEPAEGISPLQNMEQVYSHAMQFVKKFDKQFANLLLYGETGLGKTFVCHCIAKDLLDKGYTVLYLTAPRLCKFIEDFRFNRESLDAPDEMLEAVDEVDLLILDDLGVEFSTIVTSSALFDIINQRILGRKSTVISTNLTPIALEQQYSERIVSRFFGNYQNIKFFGEDIRLKKKYGGLRI